MSIKQIHSDSPSAVGSTTFSSVFAWFNVVGEKDSSWDFKSVATFGKSFNAGAAILWVKYNTTFFYTIKIFFDWKEMREEEEDGDEEFCC